MSRRLGVKMCGNCNPDIESGSVARRIASGLGMDLVHYEDGDSRLTISGCCCACVEEDYPAEAVVRGLDFNGVKCRDEDELVARAVEFFTRLNQ